MFKDKQGKMLYVGKAKNIKKRVLSHIYSKSQRSIAMCGETHHLDFVETGNELCALLLEADQIKQFYPKYNKAQKRPVKTFQIISYKNRIGVEQIALGETKSTVNSVYTLYKKIEGIEVLIALCKKYELCPKFCALQTTNNSCSHYEITDCNGVCSGEEATEIYNKRVFKALASLKNKRETFVVKQKGRTLEEEAIILVEDGEYKGFGFVDKNETILDFEDFSNHITRYKNSFHTTRIITSFIKKDTNQNYILRLLQTMA